MTDRISGVEIFRVGTWKGDRYDVADLDEMVANFDKVGYRVPVKLGHKEESGQEAYGWVERVRRVGDRLVADFVDVPAALFAKIKARAYDAVSSEIYHNVERGTQRFRRALKAVALLGAEIPAVAGLAPLRTVVNALSPSQFARVGTYTFALQEDAPMANDDPGRVLHDRVRARMYQHPSLDYEAAMKQELAHDPELARSYAMTDLSPDRADPADARTYAQDRRGAGEVIHQRCLALVEQGEAGTYGEAFERVLRDDPKLKARYAGCRP